MAIQTTSNFEYNYGTLQVKGTGTTNATTAFRVENANASGSMVVLDDGNVGIGTTTPTEKLSVVGKIDLNDGGNSVFIGTGAGLNDDASNNQNVGVGYQSLRSNTTGAGNTANGFNSLYANTTGTYNTANGYNALRFNTTGGNNTANGFQALYSNTTGTNNTANGFYSLYSNTTGVNNTANGVYSLFSNTTGNNNTANGVYSLFSNTTGGYNIATGRDAGRFISDGTTANTITDNSVYLGYNTKALADNQTNQIVIGYEATGIGSNTVVLGNDSIVTTALKGNVGIGTTSPAYKLDIQTPQGGTLARFKDSDSSYPGIVVVGDTNAGWLGNNSLLTGEGIYYQNNLNVIRIYTNSAERMRLDASGNLGIGTTPPTARLQVKGSGTTSATTAFRVEDANASASMTILDNGNVGIGGEALTSSTYKLRVYGNIWANGFSQLSSLDGSAGVGQIKYYDNGSTLRLRVYGSHGSEAVKGILALDRQDINYTSLANSIPHSASFYMDHASFVIRSNNTSADSFYLQNYMHASGALFVTNQPAGGDTSFRFRPSASITGSTDVFVINTEGVQVTGSANILGSARIDEVLTLTPLDPLPTGSPTGSFAVSASVPPIPYFYDGTSWNALY